MLTVHGVPALELTAPVISDLKVLQRSNLADATLTLSEPAELTVTLSRPMGTVPCTKFFKDRPGECQDWKPLAGTLHISAKAGANAVSLRPFGALAPGSVQVTFEPKDSFGNIGAYASAQFIVPMRCLGRRNCE